MSTYPTSHPQSAAAVLREEFHQNYGSGRDFEGGDLIEFACAAGHFLAEILGDDAVNSGMAAMVKSLGQPCAAPEDWEEAMRAAWGEAYTWPVGAIFHDLNAYAHYGFAPNGGTTAEEREQLLRSLLERAERFMARVPLEAWSLKGGDAEHTLRLARGRFALDRGEPVEPYAVASFGGISERRVRNLMSAGEGVFTNDNGKVPATEVANWLKGRETFRPSVWREQDAFEDLAQAASAELDDVVFVPVAADGSVFHPGLVRDGVFTVGPRDDERRVPSFDAALVILQRLQRPAWRRSTPQGNWGIALGVRWERLTADELKRRADATS